jgi:hypothetical protein
MQIDQTVFPKGVAGAIANPAVLGSVQNLIFSYPSSILRILGAYGIIKLSHQAAQPTTPTKYQVWVVPATLSAGAIAESNVKIYDGTAWVEPTKALWESAIGGESTTSAIGGESSAGVTVESLTTVFSAILTDVTNTTNSTFLSKLKESVFNNATFSINAAGELIVTF